MAFPLAAVLCILRGNECCSRQHGVSLLCALHFVSTHPQARAHTRPIHTLAMHAVLPGNLRALRCHRGHENQVVKRTGVKAA